MFTDVKEKLLTGYEVNGKTYKNHLDGYDFLPDLVPLCTCDEWGQVLKLDTRRPGR